MPRAFPLSRRSFLKTAAAALVLSPLAMRAAGKDRAPVAFSVVTDTHLGYRNQPAAADQWKRTAAALSKSPGKLVLHLGDVVDGGQEPQYAVYRDIRDTIGKPVHEIPGNHDPADLFAKHLREQVDTVVDHEWLRFALLGNTRFNDHDGFLSARQLDWLDQRVVEAAKDDRVVIVCMHVPAHSNQHPDRGWHVKPAEGQTRLYELLTKHERRVAALFHGHFHNGVRGWTDHAPVQEICFPSALYNQDRKLTEQKAPGYSLDEFRPGFTQVTAGEGKLKLEYRVVEVNAKPAEPAAKELPLP